jgi:hypothetical protein
MLTTGGDAHRVAKTGKELVKLSDGSINNIDNILYMLGIHRNLLSVGCISYQGCCVEFIKNTCLICDINTRQILFRGARMGKKGLYRLSAKCLQNSEICTIE